MRRCLAAGALAVAGLLAAGCSGGPNGGTGSGGTPAALNASGTSAELASFVRYASCMRTHGVPGVPVPIGFRNGKPVFDVQQDSTVNSHTPLYGRANVACRSLLLSPHGAGEQITAKDQADYLKAARCMRAHGVREFPDPVFIGGQVSFPVPTGVNVHSPQVLRAETTCRRLIPRGLPYSG